MPKRWTDDDFDALHVYFENGYDDDEIAERVGRPPNVVGNKARSIGLRRATLSPSSPRSSLG